MPAARAPTLLAGGVSIRKGGEDLLGDPRPSSVHRSSLLQKSSARTKSKNRLEVAASQRPPDSQTAPCAEHSCLRAAPQEDKLAQRSLSQSSTAEPRPFSQPGFQAAQAQKQFLAWSSSILRPRPAGRRKKREEAQPSSCCLPECQICPQSPADLPPPRSGEPLAPSAWGRSLQSALQWLLKGRPWREEAGTPSPPPCLACSWHHGFLQALTQSPGSASPFSRLCRHRHVKCSQRAQGSRSSHSAGLQSNGAKERKGSGRPASHSALEGRPLLPASQPPSPKSIQRNHQAGQTPSVELNSWHARPGGGPREALPQE